MSELSMSQCVNTEDYLTQKCELLSARVKVLEQELWTVHYQAAGCWGATSDKAKEYADKRIKEGSL